MYSHFPGSSETAVLLSGLEMLARAKWLADGCGLPSALLSTLWQPLVGYCGVCLPINPRRSTGFESATERCLLAMQAFPNVYLSALPISTALRHPAGYYQNPVLSESVL